MPYLDNRHIGDRLEEAAQLLREQGSDRFRVNAYLRAADVMRHWPEPRQTYSISAVSMASKHCLASVPPSHARSESS